MNERAPENKAEHIRQLLIVNDRQAERIKSLAKENAKLRQQNTVLRQKVGDG